MNALIGILFFLFGVIFGSFFNVVGLRLPKNENFLNDRSHCPSCKKQLRAHELIPILSFIIQGGKCRNCNAKISWKYPMIELLTGLLFLCSYLQIGLELELLTALLLVSMLIIIVVTDLAYMLIPNKVLLFFLPLFIVMRIIEPLDPWWFPIVGFILGFVMLALIILVSRGGMGGGDMKLFAVLGVVLGPWNLLLCFFLACLLGAIIGILLQLFKVIKRNQPIAFGPYIVVAALITYFYGESIILWYLNFL